VVASLTILLAIIYVPGLDPIFDTAFLSLRDWAVMLPLILAPAVAAELSKLPFRRRAT
jgi:Ca2+-transporting ATPase